MTQITIRPIGKSDCQTISDSFRIQGWDKPVQLYERYVQMHQTGERDFILAEYNDVFAGYATIAWESIYPEFKKRRIPEIVDLNVLRKFQRRGIATKLLEVAESRIRKRSPFAGIGFGLTQDYGAAQKLYIGRGYVPDGNGLVKDNQAVIFGDQVTIDDSLVFYLIKEL